MPSQLALIALSALLACAGYGCTIAGQYQDIQDTNVRVQGKEADLQYEEQRHAALQDQMKRLSVDLGNETMTANQLEARLAALQAQNRQAASDNAAQRAKKRQLDAQLNQYRAELAALKQNTTMDPETQRETIRALKAKIAQRLALLAQAE